MTAQSPFKTNRFYECWLVLALAVAVALASARDYAGSWNDGSRLATVEALVDQHTLAIERSIFVDVPAVRPNDPTPYRRQDTDLLAHGTLDKLFIAGHYYSDKSPVPALLMAAAYAPLHWLGGLQAARQPDVFCYWLTLLSSGLAYVVAVWCVYRLGSVLGLPRNLLTVFTLSFAAATVAPVYARHVNNHILLLGVAAALCLQIAYFGEQCVHSAVPLRRLLILGALVGLGYTIDLGAVPPLAVCLAALVMYRTRRVTSVAWMLCAALPWIALHHTVNYATGGTWKPANAVAEYFNWPGCPFNEQNMTGNLNHSVSHFLIYGNALLFGKRGFFGHNLPLFVAIPGLWLLARSRPREWPELAFAVGWSGCTWLAYTLTSSNYSGQCCTIRWFVPLLAPGYYVLAVALRDLPRLRVGFVALTGWGICMVALMWREGPWMTHMVPLFWPLQGLALTTWLVWSRRPGQEPASAVTDPERVPAQAA